MNLTEPSQKRKLPPPGCKLLQSSTIHDLELGTLVPFVSSEKPRAAKTVLKAKPDEVVQSSCRKIERSKLARCEQMLMH